MSPTKQRLLGGIILIIGGALMAILLLGKGNHQKASTPAITNNPAIGSSSSNLQQQIDSRPLSLDIETERKMLEDAKESRLKQVEVQEQKAAEFMQAQQNAESEAARQARLEQQNNDARLKLDNDKKQAKEAELAAKNSPVSTLEESTKLNEVSNSEVVKRPEPVAPTKTTEWLNAKKKEQATQDQIKRLKKEKELQAKKTKEVAQRKDEEIRRLKEEKEQLIATQRARENIEDEERAEKIRMERKAEMLKTEGTDTQPKNSKQQLEDVRQKAKNAKNTGNWVVQVAIARDQASADSIVARLRAKGYPVKTSNTSKGVRVMIGPEKTREPALLVKRQIDSDPSLGVNGAWIMNWQPPSP